MLSLEREPTKIRLTSNQLFYYVEQSICKFPINYTNNRYVFSCIFFYEVFVIRSTTDAAYMSSGFCGTANNLFLEVANADGRTLIFAGRFHEKSKLKSNTNKPADGPERAHLYLFPIFALHSINFCHAHSDKWDGAYRPAFDQETL